jgi:oligopeptide transport system permease protein
MAVGVATLAPKDKPLSPNQLALRRFRRNKLSLFGLIIVGIFVFIFFTADFIAPFNPTKQSTLQEARPGAQTVIEGARFPIHILGTDVLGRDILSRILYGTRVSLSVGLITEALVLLIGVPLGLLAGYYGGIADFIVMRFGEIMNSFPDLLFLIILTNVFASRSVWIIFLVLGLTGWVVMSRVVRGQVLQVKQMDYVTGARSIGARTGGIMLRHIFPNILGPIIVLVTLAIPGAILTEATLSFLGVGVEPGTITWGTMVVTGQAIMQSKPEQVLIPSMAIAILALAMTFIGDGVRDAFDPKSK